MNFGKDALHTPYPIFFYTLHTLPYPAHTLWFPVKGVKGASFTPAGCAARSASTRRFALESPEPTDIQIDRKSMKEHFLNLPVDGTRTSKNETNGNRKWFSFVSLLIPTRNDSKHAGFWWIPGVFWSKAGVFGEASIIQTDHTEKEPLHRLAKKLVHRSDAG